ncbi:MAG: hypothetical protein VXW29_01645, partial [SAR324 cluster bacterium]|nr:hypothetical protein [SAR324 cluster bacterium]
MEFTPEAYKLIFWDFDGVIKDSVPLKTEAFDQLFCEYGEEEHDLALCCTNQAVDAVNNKWNKPYAHGQQVEVN